MSRSLVTESGMGIRGRYGIFMLTALSSSSFTNFFGVAQTWHEVLAQRDGSKGDSSDPFQWLLRKTGPRNDGQEERWSSPLVPLHCSRHDAFC